MKGGKQDKRESLSLLHQFGSALHFEREMVGDRWRFDLNVQVAVRKQKVQRFAQPKDPLSRKFRRKPASCVQLLQLFHRVVVHRT